LWQKSDSSNYTIASWSISIAAWSTLQHGQHAGKLDCGHGKTVAMARLQPWHYCGHGTTTAAMATLRPQHYCGHGTTVAMALLRPRHYCSHGMTAATA